ncbi:MAG: GNAT family N-acetyltransferase [Clostridia bacterium]|nr:GNAT family N-acetyltransferase [Clostridia bacterium]
MLNKDRFEFRNIRKDEIDQAVEIEQICFPPNEACSREHISERIEAVPELFLAAIDRETGRIAGFLNGLATKEESFRDEFFIDVSLHDPDGKNVMLLGLDVLPEYRGQGLARELVAIYAKREEKNGRQQLILTCLDEKVGMYLKFGFLDRGTANSTWGSETWHEMIYSLKTKE